MADDTRNEEIIFCDEFIIEVWIIVLINVNDYLLVKRVSREFEKLRENYLFRNSLI